MKNQLILTCVNVWSTLPIFEKSEKGEISIFQKWKVSIKNQNISDRTDFLFLRFPLNLKNNKRLKFYTRNPDPTHCAVAVPVMLLLIQ